MLMVPASIRPRPRGRGIPAAASVDAAMFTGFNKATTARSWNYDLVTGVPDILRRFNKATTARSWNLSLVPSPWHRKLSFNKATTARSWNYARRH